MINSETCALQRLQKLKYKKGRKYPSEHGPKACFLGEPDVYLSRQDNPNGGNLYLTGKVLHMLGKF